MTKIANRLHADAEAEIFAAITAIAQRADTPAELQAEIARVTAPIGADYRARVERSTGRAGDLPAWCADDCA